LKNEEDFSWINQNLEQDVAPMRSPMNNKANQKRENKNQNDIDIYVEVNMCDRTIRAERLV